MSARREPTTAIPMLFVAITLVDLHANVTKVSLDQEQTVKVTKWMSSVIVFNAKNGRNIFSVKEITK